MKGKAKILATTALAGMLLLSSFPLNANAAEKTLEDLIVEENGIKTITLDDDYTTGLVINEGETYSIDLNGHDIITQDTHAIENKGTVTIKGNGVVRAEGNNKGAIANYGDATIIGGSYGSAKWYAIKNMGDMLFPEGSTASVKADGVNGSASISNGWYEAERSHINDCNNPHTSGEAKLTIKNGSIEGAANGTCAICNDNYGILEISNGNFTGGKYDIIQANNTTKIYGGTFTQTTSDHILKSYIGGEKGHNGAINIVSGNFHTKDEKPAIYVQLNDGETSNVEIHGGYFSNKVIETNGKGNAKVEVYGGSFKKEEYVEPYLKENTAVFPNGDGNFFVDTIADTSELEAELEKLQKLVEEYKQKYDKLITLDPTLKDDPEISEDIEMYPELKSYIDNFLQGLRDGTMVIAQSQLEQSVENIKFANDQMTEGIEKLKTLEAELNKEQDNEKDETNKEDNNEDNKEDNKDDIKDDIENKEENAENTSSNPKTGDNIIIFIAAFVAATLGAVIAISKTIKNRK